MERPDCLSNMLWKIATIGAAPAAAFLCFTGATSLYITKAALDAAFQCAIICHGSSVLYRGVRFVTRVDTKSPCASRIVRHKCSKLKAGVLTAHKIPGESVMGLPDDACVFR